jgi:hypothetical protein
MVTIEQLAEAIGPTFGVLGLVAGVVAWRRRWQQMSELEDQEVIERRYLHTDEHADHQHSDVPDEMLREGEQADGEPK